MLDKVILGSTLRQRLGGVPWSLAGIAIAMGIWLWVAVTFGGSPPKLSFINIVFMPLYLVLLNFSGVAKYLRSTRKVVVVSTPDEATRVSRKGFWGFWLGPDRANDKKLWGVTWRVRLRWAVVWFSLSLGSLGLLYWLVTVVGAAYLLNNCSALITWEPLVFLMLGFGGLQNYIYRLIHALKS